jgi:putative transposase
MQGRFKGHHLRKYRVSQVGNLCVLTCVVIGREPVFQDLRAGRRVVAQFRSAHERGLVDSLAWVVMPDHFHWLVELRTGTLSTLMCQVKSRSSRMIQMANSHPGPLWQRGYYERTLRRDEDILAAARYIVANPLRAGLVRRVEDYSLWDARWI